MQIVIEFSQADKSTLVFSLVLDKKTTESSFSLFWTKGGIEVCCSGNLTGSQLSHTLTAPTSVYGLVFKIIL